ncbi:MAG: DUF2520 domain-containing protein [Gammaproteobacteria bacterium]|nr:DUF2520 domain-containing protein [Gammaproteobacteria bacterium]
MKKNISYLIIGNGRLARHVQFYFNALGLQHECWHRHQGLAKLAQCINKASHILILIADDAIIPFAESYLMHTDAMLIHCSGCLISDKIFGAHPLSTFNQTLYTLDNYQSIPFVIDDDAPDFRTLLPGIPNPHIRLNKSKKEKYHAMCVLAGNFSCLLWLKLFTTFEREFNIPASFAHDYLRQQTANLLADASTALTGPLTRGDTLTISKHLQTLERDPFKEVYVACVNGYQQLNNEDKI